jgi:hypothetical protein
MRAPIIAAVLALTSAAGFGPSPASAEAERSPFAASSELSSQEARPPRARTRIRVTPLRRTGPLVRECDFRLVREVRAAGTYVVPQQRCWWTRAR